MAKNKTVEAELSVNEFIEKISDTEKREDSYQIIDLISRQLLVEPRIWGTSIIGFGSYHYKYASGREGDAPLVGFSPRSKAISIYLSCDDYENREELLQQLGKYKMGKNCIYIKRLKDINTNILMKMIHYSILIHKK
ncbi:DUF1801 domain-containing protein [Olivibacter sp. SDN3]|uniref:DUF1801 domain-containing protein n=1 Tax=Olivibacter sp. SDN3 TaxID=2764720 RepID=UPI00165185FA|nr:DUF1801 domain-containing protein [Olivibacter sp. SDN3]QNL49390.1 DUF1801 domain-containing protein [Olivibacter sp. SDN3]